MNRINRLIFVLGITFLMCTFAFSVSAQDESDQISLSDLFDIDISAASKIKQKSTEAPGVVYVVTRREIDQMGSKTLGDVLNYVPGFESVRSVAINEHENINVRGKASMYSEAVLILVDGIRQTDVIYGSPVVISRYYDLHNVERIEIIRGPGSALYGAGAFVGVVNIITRSGKNNQDLLANIEGGSFGTINGSIYKGHEFNNNLSISAAFQYNDEDGEDYENLTTKFGRPVAETEDPVEDYEFNFKLNYDSDTFTNEVGLKVMHKEDSDFIPDGWRNNKLSGVDNITENSVHTFYSRMGLPFLEQGNVALTLSIVDSENDNYYQLFEPAELVGMGQSPTDIRVTSGRGGLAGPLTETITYTGELQVQWDFTDTHNLIGGFNYQKDEPEKHFGQANIDLSQPPPALVNPMPEYTKFDSSSEDDRKVIGIYLQDTIEIIEKVKTTIGVRYDDYNDVGNTVNPRLAMVYLPDDETSIKFLAATAFRAPSYAELYHHNNPSSRGNPDLDPEKIQTYELYAQRRFMEKFQVSGNIYYSKIEDFITTVGTPGSVADFVNYGDHESIGFETEFKFIYDLRNTVTLNYSYTDPKDEETDEDIHNIANHAFNFIFNKSITEYFDLSLHGYYRSSRDRAVGDTRDDVDSYTVVNAKLTANIYENMKAYLKGTNIFDEEYYGPEGEDLVPGDTPNRGPGVYVGIEGKF